MTQDEAKQKASMIMEACLPGRFWEGGAKALASLNAMFAMALVDAYKLGRASVGHELARLHRRVSELTLERSSEEDFDTLSELAKTVYAADQDEGLL